MRSHCIMLLLQTQINLIRIFLKKKMGLYSRGYNQKDALVKNYKASIT